MHAASRAAIEKITGPWLKVSELKGGSIASISRIDAVNGPYVLKQHKTPPDGFFASERACLETLKSAGVPTPEIITAGEDFLLMSYIAPGEVAEAAAGEALAHLHNTRSPQCGFQQDTYLATFLQPNAPASAWADFYLDHRLAPMLGRLDLESAELNLWRDFGKTVRPHLGKVNEFSLLHGDLWPGNLLYGETGPVFIDPACYFGDGLVDIAMSRLFGGLGEAFYASYFSLLPPREDSELLQQVYQVYPLLTHAVLFGSAYYAQAQSIRDDFLVSRGP
ncbi:fructosamine kinase family protein [Turneriella parva]|uniref:Fructosamine/Ketosamine-3-kinase n=1 Tax=Turneriella parva (strain ATCC BAA-1111 / DSM 21527 / NCTC 11395 / H) TaxID=869212 RepID=I4B8V9_TURPD|nr:fructosamine kinase family protein [Turneriella parva]AFM13716.1 Fructosamine/Ketosamine-3-kinase [Turneriella parva DSM 21527]